eukprot:229125_1
MSKSFVMELIDEAIEDLANWKPQPLPINTITEEKKMNEEGIIFMGGSFNPVHTEHLQMLLLIKDYFERTYIGLKIIAGYLVITTDGYVYGKLKNEAISFEHRKTLCGLICKSDKYKWIHPSHVQCSSSIQYLQKYFINKHPYALMINAMGADKILKGKNKNTGKWRKYSTNYKQRKCLTVCINRKGYCDQAYKLYKKDCDDGKVDPKAFCFIDGNVKDISSTMIRNILKKYRNDINRSKNRKEYVKELINYANLKCVNYLLDNIDCIWYDISKKVIKDSSQKRPMKDIIFFD